MQMAGDHHIRAQIRGSSQKSAAAIDAVKNKMQEQHDAKTSCHEINKSTCRASKECGNTASKILVLLAGVELATY
jgi:hypothetical protein